MNKHRKSTEMELQKSFKLCFMGFVETPSTQIQDIYILLEKASLSKTFAASISIWVVYVLKIMLIIVQYLVEMLLWSEPSSLCLICLHKASSLLFVARLLLLRESSRWEPEHIAKIGLSETECSWKLGLSCRCIACNELLLLPEHLLLHLSVHLLLPEHLLIDHLLLLGSKDIDTHRSTTLKCSSTWESTAERWHTHWGTWETSERCRHLGDLRLLNWNLLLNNRGRLRNL